MSGRDQVWAKTPVQAEQVFTFLVAHKSSNDGESPSLRQIAQGTGLTIGQAHRAVRYLEKMGRVSRARYSSRILVSGGRWTYSGE